MEIIQEIIGSRKKQQLVINNEAKRTLHKQIKKVIQREVSEPPPKVQTSHSQLYTKQDSKEQKYTPQDGSEPHTFDHEVSKEDSLLKQYSMAKNQANLQLDEDSGSPGYENNGNTDTSGSRKRDLEQLKELKASTTDHKTAQQKIAALKAEKRQTQNQRIRKVRSKSPTTAEGGKTTANKVKKFYGQMIPAFTNKKRQNSYYNHPKQGFNYYINWDMENELYLFQTQIEQKFKKSQMNRTYKFPYVQPRTLGRVNNNVLLDQTPINSNGNKLFHLSGTPESMKQQARFFSPLTPGERTNTSSNVVRNAAATVLANSPLAKITGSTTLQAKHLQQLVNRQIKQDETLPENTLHLQPVVNDSSTNAKHKKKKAQNETITESEKNKTDQSIPTETQNDVKTKQTHLKSKQIRDKMISQTSTNNLKMFKDPKVVASNFIKQNHNSSQLFSPQSSVRRANKQMSGHTNYLAQKGNESRQKASNLYQSQSKPQTPLMFSNNSVNNSGHLREQSARVQKQCEQQGQSELPDARGATSASMPTTRKQGQQPGIGTSHIGGGIALHQKMHSSTQSSKGASRINHHKSQNIFNNSTSLATSFQSSQNKPSGRNQQNFSAQHLPENEMKEIHDNQAENKMEECNLRIKSQAEYGPRLVDGNRANESGISEDNRSPDLSKKQKRHATEINFTAYGIAEDHAKKIHEKRAMQSSAQALRNQSESQLVRSSIQPTTHHRRGQQMTLMQGLGPGGVMMKNAANLSHKSSQKNLILSSSQQKSKKYLMKAQGKPQSTQSFVNQSGIKLRSSKTAKGQRFNSSTPRENSLIHRNSKNDKISSILHQQMPQMIETPSAKDKVPKTIFPQNHQIIQKQPSDLEEAKHDSGHKGYYSEIKKQQSSDMSPRNKRFSRDKYQKGQSSIINQSKIFNSSHKKGTRIKSLQKPLSNDNLETEECEDFDMRDLDEREPCQTLQDSMMNDKKQNEKVKKKLGAIVPLTTRSTQSAALVQNLHANKQSEKNNQTISAHDGIQSEIPAYNVEIQNSSRQDDVGSTRGISNVDGSPRSSNELHQVDLVNDQRVSQAKKEKLKSRNLGQTSIQTPKVQQIVVTSFHNLNTDAIDPRLGNTESKTVTARSRLHHGSERLFSPGIGQSASNTNLNVNNQIDLCSKFQTEENSAMGIDVIKEENKRRQIKSKGTKRNRAMSNGAYNGLPKTINGPFPQSHFSMTQMQSTGHQSAVANRVLNLPPKPSRNIKNSTLVLGNSSSIGLHTRSVQNFMIHKKNPAITSMANATSSVIHASAKKDQSVPSTFFKSSSKKQERAKGSFKQEQITALALQSSSKSNARNSGGITKLGSDRRMDTGILRAEISPLKSVQQKKSVTKNHSQMNFDMYPKTATKQKINHYTNSKVEMKSASVANFSLSMIATQNDLTLTQKQLQMPHLEKGQQQRIKESIVDSHNNQVYMSINKTDQLRNNQNRNRDKSKSSDHYRQACASPSTNDYDLMIDQQDIRAVNNFEDEEEHPRVMVVSDVEPLEKQNYIQSVLHQPQRNDKIEMIDGIAQEHTFASLHGGSKSKLFAPLPQQPGMPMSPNQILHDRGSPVKMTKKPLVSKVKQASIPINVKSPTGYQAQTTTPNILALKGAPHSSTLQPQKSFKKITNQFTANQQMLNPMHLKNKPELLRLSEPMSKDIGKTQDKGAKKKQSKKIQNK